MTPWQLLLLVFGTSPRNLAIFQEEQATLLYKKCKKKYDAWFLSLSLCILKALFNAFAKATYWIIGLFLPQIIGRIFGLGTWSVIRYYHEGMVEVLWYILQSEAKLLVVLLCTIAFLVGWLLRLIYEAELKSGKGFFRALCTLPPRLRRRRWLLPKRETTTCVSFYEKGVGERP